MQHHVSSFMLDFNLTRLLFSLHLNAHTIAYLNQFKLFRKDANFRVLHLNLAPYGFDPQWMHCYPFRGRKSGVQGEVVEARRHPDCGAAGAHFLLSLTPLET